ncbi:hypothetical protein BOW50_11925 [Solemya velum gill symbiont]|uniref:hypothetical protein n=1 Tax=Solemya velum gill symbiont TaxID=2340 RepID=UPI000996AB55|nr:hypothetical protein [Solemya velum gill symbiont]OOZ75387.1 hypothetical protein BOW50_11925 [Solemya velum gill symbiont]
MSHDKNSPPKWLLPKFDNFLPELITQPNWVLTKPVLRDGKWTKPPLQPDGRYASATNPKTWSSFGEVKQAFDQGDFAAVGFVLDGNPHFCGKYLHGFDWDECIVSGKLDAQVEIALKELKIPRVEISVSGTGI